MQRRPDGLISSTPGCPTARPNVIGSNATAPLKYEHLYRLEIADLPSLAHEAEAYRQIFNHIRPHEALGLNRPIEIHQDPTRKPPTEIENTQPSGHNS